MRAFFKKNEICKPFNIGKGLRQNAQVEPKEEQNILSLESRQHTVFNDFIQQDLNKVIDDYIENHFLIQT